MRRFRRPGLLLASALGAWAENSASQPDVAPEPSPAPSAYHFLEGVYSSEPDCASGPDAADGAAYLDREGLRAASVRCDFVTFHGARNSQSFIAAAICHGAAEDRPETILVRNETIEEFPARIVRVVYRGDMAQTIFHRCADPR